MISHPHWARAPTFAQVAAAIPSNARRRAVDGRATIGCSFNHDGTLRDCRVLSENPPGLGFGLAAQGLTRQFQLQTIGLPTGFRVRDAGVVIPFSFPANAGATDAPVLGRPRWVTRPNADSAATAYPAAALAANVSGSGLVACSVGPNGALADCAVVSETPEGQGFGAAALRLSTAFTMGLWSDEGLPTHGARVTLPIMFRPPPPADAPPASPAP